MPVNKRLVVDIENSLVCDAYDKEKDGADAILEIYKTFKTMTSTDS